MGLLDIYRNILRPCGDTIGGGGKAENYKIVNWNQHQRWLSQGQRLMKREYIRVLGTEVALLPAMARFRGGDCNMRQATCKYMIRN